MTIDSVLEGLKVISGSRDHFCIIFKSSFNFDAAYFRLSTSIKRQVSSAKKSYVTVCLNISYIIYKDQK